VFSVSSSDNFGFLHFVCKNFLFCVYQNLNLKQLNNNPHFPLSSTHLSDRRKMQSKNNRNDRNDRNDRDRRGNNQGRQQQQDKNERSDQGRTVNRSQPQNSVISPALNSILRKPSGGTSTNSNENTNRRGGGGTPSTSDMKSSAPLPTEPLGSREIYDFGMVHSLRSAFGFIQSIFSDESFYFSEREFYKDMKVGDLVTFEVKNGAKGLAAQSVRHFPPLSASSPTIHNVKGTVSRSSDRHRSTYGLIEVDAAAVAALPAPIKNVLQKKNPPLLPFQQNSVVKESLPKSHFLDRGDFVEFSLVTVEENGFYVATDVKYSQSKRDRAAVLQIQRMLAAGAVRELGVVSAVKNQEYGFIRAQDRKDEIYFRVDDIKEKEAEEGGDTTTTTTTIPTVKEGMEVEFFVIAEMVRGKLCERAIHLNFIPAGTVQFETVVASNIHVQVTLEPGLPPAEEVPGEANLIEPHEDGLVVENLAKDVKSMKIKTVDLWSRCMPDDLLTRKGDQLSVNIHYYRPEKIFFVRNVRIRHYFPLGRDTGTIVTIKGEGSFGFIKSDIRKCDLYFKTNQVTGKKGGYLPEHDVKKGMVVTFDCSIEEGNKLRAVRVHFLAENETVYQQQMANDADLVLEKNIVGVVARTTNKRDTVGLIKVTHQKFKELSDIVFVDPSIAATLRQFVEFEALTALEIPVLPEFQRKLYHQICDSQFPKIGHEDFTPASVINNNSNMDVNEMKTLKLWKKSEKELAEGGAHKNSSGRMKSSSRLNKDGTISFNREDYTSEDLGALMNDMEVVFDLCWDRSKNKKIARNIRLTDEPIEVPEEDLPLTGVIDTVIPQSTYRSGFLRVLKTDEKLFWMIKNDSNNNNNKSGGEEKNEQNNNSEELAVDQEVSFELRKRGGLRCAANIKPVSKDIASKEEVLPVICTGLVINNNEVILLDTSSDSNLSLRYIEPKLLEALVANHLASKEAARASIANKEIKEHIKEQHPTTTTSSSVAVASSENPRSTSPDNEIAQMSIHDNKRETVEPQQEQEQQQDKEQEKQQETEQEKEPESQEQEQEQQEKQQEGEQQSEQPTGKQESETEPQPTEQSEQPKEETPEGPQPENEQEPEQPTVQEQQEEQPAENNTTNDNDLLSSTVPTTDSNTSAPPTAPATAAAGTSSSSSSSTERVEYKPKYFPPVSRLSIPLQFTGDSSKFENLVKPGDIISCQVVVNWAVKRTPVHIQVIDILSSATAIKKRGKIVTLKQRMNKSTQQIVNHFTNPTSSSSSSSSSSFPSLSEVNNITPEHIKRYRLNEVDWTEIEETFPMEKKAANPLAESRNENNEVKIVAAPAVNLVPSTYYCLFNEIYDANANHHNLEHRRESVETGEEVEYWVLPNYQNLVFGVSTVAKKDFGVSFVDFELFCCSFFNWGFSFFYCFQFGKSRASAAGVNVNVEQKLKPPTAIITMAKVRKILVFLVIFFFLWFSFLHFILQQFIVRVLQWIVQWDSKQVGELLIRK
jgi:cold shock CspA family protein